MALLNVKDLTIVDMKTEKTIVHDLSFELFENDFLGIIGESGSGKTMTMKEILRVNPPWITSFGSIEFENKKITNQSIESIRGNQITMILQDGMTAFNPLRKIGWQMSITFQEVLGVSKRKARELSIDGLAKLSFPNPSETLNKYPHELSGGMLQRCMIAIALVTKPKILIADEPTSALDSLSQLEMIKEIERIKDATQVSFILVSHDLAVIQRLAKRVIVIKDGTVVESGTVDQVFNNPQNPYTQDLIIAKQKLSIV
jgi:nickel transport system ATP-binding protein